MATMDRISGLRYHLQLGHIFNCLSVHQVDEGSSPCHYHVLGVRCSVRVHSCSTLTGSTEMDVVGFNMYSQLHGRYPRFCLLCTSQSLQLLLSK